MDGKIETRKSLLNQYNIYDANIIFASVAKISSDTQRESSWAKRTIQCVKLQANRLQKVTQSKLECLRWFKCVCWCIFMANIKTVFFLSLSVLILLENDSFFAFILVLVNP